MGENKARIPLRRIGPPVDSNAGFCVTISRFILETEIIKGSRRRTGTMVCILDMGIERGKSGSVMATPGFRTGTKYSVAPSRIVCASVQHRWRQPLLGFPRQSANEENGGSVVGFKCFCKARPSLPSALQKRWRSLGPGGVDKRARRSSEPSGYEGRFLHIR